MHPSPFRSQLVVSAAGSGRRASVLLEPIQVAWWNALGENWPAWFLLDVLSREQFATLRLGLGRGVWRPRGIWRPRDFPFSFQVVESFSA